MEKSFADSPEKRIDRSNPGRGRLILGIGAEKTLTGRER
jgi:hypothetical protein